MSQLEHDFTKHLRKLVDEAENSTAARRQIMPSSDLVSLGDNAEFIPTPTLETVLCLLCEGLNELVYDGRNIWLVSQEDNQDFLSPIRLQLSSVDAQKFNEVIQPNGYFIGKIGVFGIFLHFEPSICNFWIELRKDGKIANQPIAPNIVLKFPAARAVVKAGLHGEVQSVSIDMNSRIIRYQYRGSQSVLHIDPTDPDYAFHVRIAQNEELIVGAEMANKVFYNRRHGYIESHHGRPIATDELYQKDPEIEQLIDLSKVVTDYYLTGNEVTGVLIMTDPMGQRFSIDSSLSPRDFRLMCDLLQNRTIEAGYTTNGFDLVYTANSGLMLKKGDRHSHELPKALSRLRLFSILRAGSYFYFNDIKGKKAFVQYRFNGLLTRFESTSSLYPLLQRLCDGKIGYFFIPTHTSAPSSKNNEGRVYLVYHDPKLGIGFEDYPGHIEGNKVIIHQLPPEYQHILFVITDDLLDASDITAEKQLQKNMDDKTAKVEASKRRKARRSQRVRETKKMKGQIK